MACFRLVYCQYRKVEYCMEAHDLKAFIDTLTFEQLSALHDALNNSDNIVSEDVFLIDG